MKTSNILAFILGALLLAGCSAVPETVQQTIENKQAGIMRMHSELAEYQSENQIEIIVQLPPGNYAIPEGEPFELARVSVPQDMTVASLAAFDAIGRIRIPENTIISGLRAITPLAGFAIGAWQNVAIHQSNTDMMRNIAGGMFQLNSEFIQDPPIVQPEIVRPEVVQPQVVTPSSE